jgi:hypothetical protein
VRRLSPPLSLKQWERQASGANDGFAAERSRHSEPVVENARPSHCRIAACSVCHVSAPFYQHQHMIISRVALRSTCKATLVVSHGRYAVPHGHFPKTAAGPRELALLHEFVISLVKPVRSGRRATYGQGRVRERLAADQEVACLGCWDFSGPMRVEACSVSAAIRRCGPRRLGLRRRSLLTPLNTAY